jgi:hypothetical protein
MGETKTKEIIIASGAYVSGIDGGVAEEIISVTSTPDMLRVGSLGRNIEVKPEDIIGIRVQTHTDVQQQYVSSAGGAVAGAMLAGVPGALVGGRDKKKEIKDTTNYLVITYKSCGEVNNIVLKLYSIDNNVRALTDKYDPLQNIEMPKKKHHGVLIFLIVVAIFLAIMAWGITREVQKQNNTAEKQIEFIVS